MFLENESNSVWHISLILSASVNVVSVYRYALFFGKTYELIGISLDYLVLFPQVRLHSLSTLIILPILS